MSLIFNPQFLVLAIESQIDLAKFTGVVNCLDRLPLGQIVTGHASDFNWVTQ
jgi:hypothetical protein